MERDCVVSMFSAFLNTLGGTAVMRHAVHDDTGLYRIQIHAELQHAVKT